MVSKHSRCNNNRLKQKQRNSTKCVYICFMLCYDIVTKEMENKTRRS